MKNATSAGLVRRATKVAARVSLRQLDASSRWMALDANSSPPPVCSGLGTRVGSSPVIAGRHATSATADLGEAVVPFDYIRRSRGLEVCGEARCALSCA